MDRHLFAKILLMVLITPNISSAMCIFGFIGGDCGKRVERPEIPGVTPINIADESRSTYNKVKLAEAKNRETIGPLWSGPKFDNYKHYRSYAAAKRNYEASLEQLKSAEENANKHLDRKRNELNSIQENIKSAVDARREWVEGYEICVNKEPLCSENLYGEFAKSNVKAQQQLNDLESKVAKAQEGIDSSENAFVKAYDKWEETNAVLKSEHEKAKDYGASLATQLEEEIQKLKSAHLKTSFESLRNKALDMNDQLDMLEEIYDSSLLGTYVRDKVERLLQSQSLCSAVQNKCQGNFDTYDIFPEAMPGLSRTNFKKKKSIPGPKSTQ